MAASWSAFGRYDKNARGNFFGMALAFIVASETFLNPNGQYSLWMCATIFASSAYVAWQAYLRKSWLGLAFSALGLIWIGPILDPNVFASIDPWFMAAHSAYAIGAAISAFTFLKADVKKND